MRNKKITLLQNERLTGAIFIITFLVIMLFSGSPLAWFLLGLPLSFLMTIIGIAILVIYIKKYRNKPKVLLRHLPILLLSSLATVSMIWSFMIATTNYSVDSKVNTIEEFREQAQNCAISGIQMHHNDSTHRINGNEVYIEVSTSSDYLYFSATQKDALKKILLDYSDKCPEYAKVDTGSSAYWNPTWNLERVSERVW